MLQSHPSYYRRVSFTMPLAAPRPSRSHLIPDVVYALEKMAERADEQQSFQLRSPPRSDALYLRTAAQLSASQHIGSHNAAWTDLPFLHVLAPNIAEPSHGLRSATFPRETYEPSTFAPARFAPPFAEVFPQTYLGVEDEFEDEDAEGSVYDDTELVEMDPEFVMDEDEEAEGEMGDEEMQLFSGDDVNPSSVRAYGIQERPLDHLSNNWLNPTHEETADHSPWPTIDIPLVPSSSCGFTSGTEALPYDSDPPMLLFSPLDDYCFSAPALSATSSSSSSSPASFIPHSNQSHLSHSLHLQGISKNDATRLWRPEWDKSWVSPDGHPSHPAVVYGHGMY